MLRPSCFDTKGYQTSLDIGAPYIQGQVYRSTRKHPACLKVDALKYTQRI